MFAIPVVIYMFAISCVFDIFATPFALHNLFITCLAHRGGSVHRGAWTLFSKSCCGCCEVWPSSCEQPTPRTLDIPPPATKGEIFVPRSLVGLGVVLGDSMGAVRVVAAAI